MPINKLQVACIVILLGGCVTIPGNAPPYSPAPTPKDGRVNLYIYRIGAKPSLRATTISIDAREVLDIPEHAYTVVVVSPGKHSFDSRWAPDTGAPALSFAFDVLPDKPLFLKLSGDFTARTYQWTFTSVVSTPAQELAEKELHNCCKRLLNKY